MYHLYKQHVEAKNLFLSSWDRAVEARQEQLQSIHSDFDAEFEFCINKILKHSGCSNMIQMASKMANLGLALGASVVTGDSSIVEDAAPLVLSLGKRVSVSKYNQKIQQYSNEAVAILERDHKARQEFLLATQKVEKARMNLVNVCPEFKGINSIHIMMILRYPGLSRDIATVASTDDDAIYMVMNQPETTADLVTNLVTEAFDLLVKATIAFGADEERMMFLEEIFDEEPMIGLGINIVKHYWAKNDEQQESFDPAEKLLNAYKESLQQYEKVKAIMVAYTCPYDDSNQSASC
jgi:hypothetical protein